MFQAGVFQIVKANDIDLAEIQGIYNSNKVFLLNHTGASAGAADEVDNAWCLKDYCDMLNNGFTRCKIVEAEGNPAIGFLDFKIAEEAYLSLLILRKSRQGRGIGKEVYLGFEEYVRDLNCKRVRVDVVNNYEGSSLGFWLKNGFVLEKNVLLSWGEYRFPAKKMMKELI